MIFACIGAQGTGKTTVLNKLRELGFYATDGISRPLIRAGLHKSMGQLEFQTLLNNLTMHHHYPFTQVEQTAFFTRSILDCIAYGRVNGIGGQGDWEDKAYEWFNEHRKAYVVIYFPIEFDIVGDPEREADAEYQRKVDQECLKVLKDLDVDYYEVSGTVEQRVNQVLHIHSMIGADDVEFDPSHD